ncbi:MAG: ABC transporter ATP-binding protein [Planctomycetes bacterium]|nr:ABC transporter ATP-binding protein [Planctomycetota bacterium]
MAEIVLEGLTKIYPSDVQALGNLNLGVPSGEWLVLVGPSGCGKTTTLRLIAGLETPTSGIIRIGGRVVNSLPPRQRDVAMVFQRPALFPNRTVYGNLSFGLMLRLPGTWPFASRNISEPEGLLVRETARLLQIEDLLDRYPGQLSGGEQQRVALGRALVRRTAVALLDEPFGHLDAPLRRKFLHELPLLRKRFPTTMVIVTHDPAEAFALGDRVAVMQGGNLLQVGLPEDLRRNPANEFVAELVR